MLSRRSQLFIAFVFTLINFSYLQARARHRESPLKGVQDRFAESGAVTLADLRLGRDWTCNTKWNDGSSASGFTRFRFAKPVVSDKATFEGAPLGSFQVVANEIPEDGAYDDNLPIQRKFVLDDENMIGLMPLCKKTGGGKYDCENTNFVESQFFARKSGSHLLFEDVFPENMKSSDSDESSLPSISKPRKEVYSYSDCAPSYGEEFLIPLLQKNQATFENCIFSVAETKSERRVKENEIVTAAFDFELLIRGSDTVEKISFSMDRDDYRVKRFLAGAKDMVQMEFISRAIDTKAYTHSVETRLVATVDPQTDELINLSLTKNLVDHTEALPRYPLTCTLH